MSPRTADSKPSMRRLSTLAVAVLEDAAIAARFEPIQRTVAHRLALAWLAYVGISETWRTTLFWKLLGESEGLDRPDGQYCRDGEFARCLNGWRRLVDLPPKNDWYR